MKGIEGGLFFTGSAKDRCSLSDMCGHLPPAGRWCTKRCTPWHGQRDLDPRHAVLETVALPTELCPCKAKAVRRFPVPYGF